MSFADGTDRARRLRAILLMLGGVACLALTDAIAKWLVDRYSPAQIVLGRGIVAVPCIVALILWRDGVGGLASRRPLVHLGRGALILLATYAFFGDGASDRAIEPSDRGLG